MTRNISGNVLSPDSMFVKKETYLGPELFEDRPASQVEPEPADEDPGFAIPAEPEPVPVQAEPAKRGPKPKQDREPAPPVAKPREPLVEHGSDTASRKKGNVVTHVLTDAESNLLTHAYTGDVDWGAVCSVVDDFELMKDPMAIPPECATREQKKEFKYRWLNPEDQERFGMQTSGQVRWFVCNRQNAPYIEEKHRDANGLVRMGKLVLAKMPWPMYVIRQNRVWKMASTPPKVGPKEGYEGRLEYTGLEGGKLRSGDIIMAEEQVVNPDSNRTRIVLGARKWTGDSD